MSKADGWDKQPNGYEWRKHTDRYRAEIFRVTGGHSPYEWAVYGLPREKYVNEKGYYLAADRGYADKLALAKICADAAIAVHFPAPQPAPSGAKE